MKQNSQPNFCDYNNRTANNCSDIAVEVQSKHCNMVWVTVTHSMQCSTALYCSDYLKKLQSPRGIMVYRGTTANITF